MRRKNKTCIDLVFLSGLRFVRGVVLNLCVFVFMWVWCLAGIPPNIPGWAPPPHTVLIPAGPRTLLCTRTPPALEVATQHRETQVHPDALLSLFEIKTVHYIIKSMTVCFKHGDAKSNHEPNQNCSDLWDVIQECFVESLDCVGMHLHTVGDELDEVGNRIVSNIAPCL